MKQIDQDPRDYRAAPVKGEPVFAPGGLNKFVYSAGLFLILGVAAIIFAMLFGPLATWFADNVTAWIFN